MEGTSRNTLIIVLIFLFAILLYSMASIFASDNSEENEEIIIVENHEEVKILEDENKVQFYDEEYWTGLPISSGNIFYVEPSKKTEEKYAEYVSKLNQAKDKSEERNTTVMDAIYNEYCEYVGLNGIIDGIHDSAISNSHNYHHLGEYLYEKIMEKSGNLTYGIEIASRRLLAKAPLHGFVWSSINGKLIDMIEKQNTTKEIILGDSNMMNELFHFVDNLCFMKTYTKFSTIYISCVHGVGHGLSDIFGKKQISDALKICTMKDNMDFKYSCASGIYMDLTNDFDPEHASFAPCDTNVYPATCFRFLSAVLGHLEASDVEFPCFHIPDRYYQVGCVWGLAYAEPKKDMNFKYAYEYCRKYEVPYIAHFASNDTIENDSNLSLEEIDTLKFQNRIYVSCVDGYLTRGDLHKKSKKKVSSICKKFSDNKNALKHCMKLGKPKKDYEDEDGDGIGWAYDILEFDYDPTYVPVAIPFHVLIHHKDKNKDKETEENNEENSHNHLD